MEALKHKLGLGDSHALIFDTPVTYRTKLLDMDAKEFGLPQTRTRKCGLCPPRTASLLPPSPPLGCPRPPRPLRLLPRPRLLRLATLQTSAPLAFGLPLPTSLL